MKPLLTIGALDHITGE